jgi:hypothetical protein
MVLDLAHFFQIQEPLGLVQKSSLVPCTQLHTPLDDIYCTCAEFYYKLN